MKIDRKEFLKAFSSFAVMSMILGRPNQAFAETDEQVGELGLSETLANLMGENEYEGWIVPPQYGGKIKILPLYDRFKEARPGQSAKLIRFEEGVVVPAHMHPEGEFTYVLSGRFSIENGTTDQQDQIITKNMYEKNDYIWMPAGSIHGKALSYGATIVSMTPADIKYQW